MKHTIERTILGDLGPAMRETLAELTVKPNQDDFPEIVEAGGTVKSFARELLQRGPIDTPVFLALKEMSADVLGWAFETEMVGISVFVTPTARRQGIGTALVKALHEDAAKKLRLRSVAHDEAGHAFYASLKSYVDHETGFDLGPMSLGGPPRRPLRGRR